ncbi:P-loop containing nucleoside triphosphate hydrolase protein [Fistulina hepatica ATCC 64428]|nr:P-loop containing nucleoside triphosphate hydrolase protein [Fistulina hepatica ATCC 64428]
MVRCASTWLKCGRRYASTAPGRVKAGTSDDAAKIRNIALVAHIDSGKTTLTESVLYQSSYLPLRGFVDTGSTTTDFLPAERARGITIQSASIPVKWKDWTFNLIDTPGHADFGMEVESASRVVDGAVVVIDSVEGVEAQTKGVWRQLDRYGVPTRIMFLNKLDRPGASFRSSLLSLLTNRFHPNPMALTLPIASFNPESYNHAEPGIEGIVDLVNWEVWKREDDATDANHSRHPLPTNLDELTSVECLRADHPIVPHLFHARTALLDNLSMHSEELMETLLNLPSGKTYLDISPSLIMKHLRRATLDSYVLPVLCGSAIRDIGTLTLLNYIGELLASPLDVEHEKQNANAPLRMLAWKVGWDSRKGWMTYVRVYSGTLKRHSALYNTNRHEKERVSKLLLLYANQAEEVDELPFGSVGVIIGLRFTRTGDTLVALHSPTSTHHDHLRDIVPPPAVVSASVLPLTHSDLEPVQNALTSLSRTDPSVRVETQEGQLLVHGLGTLHLEIVEGRLRDEFGAQFEFGRRYVSYRETLNPGDYSTREEDVWTGDVGTGRPLLVSIKMDIRPLEDHEQGDPQWDGNIVVNKTGKPLPTLGTLRDNQDGFIGRGIASALSSSPHSSLPMTRVHIQVKDHSIPNKFDTYLTPAAAHLVRECLRRAGMGRLMEPYVAVEVTVDEESIGKVVKDLTEHAGEVLDLTSGSVLAEAASSSGIDADIEEPYSEDGVYVPPDWLSPSGAASFHDGAVARRVKRSVHAVAPLSQMLDYSNRLRAISGGKGLFIMRSAGFKAVSKARQMEIMKEIGRAV